MFCTPDARISAWGRCMAALGRCGWLTVWLMGGRLPAHPFKQACNVQLRSSSWLGRDADAAAPIRSATARLDMPDRLSSTALNPTLPRVPATPSFSPSRTPTDIRVRPDTTPPCSLYCECRRSVPASRYSPSPLSKACPIRDRGGRSFLELIFPPPLRPSPASPREPPMGCRAGTPDPDLYRPSLSRSPWGRFCSRCLRPDKY